MRYNIIDRRYKILKKLGAGAMGEVYKVEDLKNNNIIALKLLSRKKTSSETVQRFKREFRLLAELHHPNLCEVYDFGTLRDGRSYFTMEYIEGKNIFTASKGLSYERLYGWVVQLCRALQYIHSKGLIHYDIKPGNVLIQYSENTTCVKLMDFGLVGEQKIKGGILIKGTLPYIAPEVIKGLAIDHRADLYSLGVLLYEIFTRKPLQIDVQASFTALLQQSKKQVAEQSSRYIISIPRRLERLILTLIDSEPAGRFNRANEVIKEINRISREKYTVETEKTIEGHLLSSRFVGRDKEIELLKSRYAKARRGDGKVILVTGDAGVGKSRLLREFKILIQTERGHCVTGYASRDRIGSFEPFHDIFKELINQINPKLKLSHGLKLAFAILFKIFPDLTIKYLKKKLPELVPLEPAQEKLRMFGALFELIEYCVSSLGELVIVLEDLHWADDVTFQFLEYLGRNLEGKNILICGTSRKRELRENPVLKRIIHTMQKEGHLEQVELKPFTYKSLYSFLDSTITSTSNSPRLTRYLMSKTDGNPFFVEETLRTLLQKGRVNIGERIGIEELKQITIPRTVTDVVLQRIVDLDENSREIINFAAILLNDFSYDLMQKLTRLEDNKLSYSLLELKRRGVLIEQDRKYQFYHTILREIIIKNLRKQNRKRLNFQIGKALEDIHKKNLDKVIEDLAYYFINAKDRKKGVKYGLLAAKKSSKRYANEQAIRFYRGVLSLLRGEDLKHRFNILRELAEIETYAGDYGVAIKHYNKTVNLKIGAIDEKIQIYLAICSIYEKKREHKKALNIYRKVLKLIDKMKNSRFKNLLETNVNVKICRAYQIIGDYERVDKFNFNNMKIFTNLKQKKFLALQGNTCNILGIIEYNKRVRSTTVIDKDAYYYRIAYMHYKKIGSVSGIAGVLNNLGLTHYMNSNMTKASKCFQKAIKISENIADHFGATLALSNYGRLLGDQGCYLRALDCFEKALTISKKIGLPEVLGFSSENIGACFLNLCNYGKAKSYLEAAVRISSDRGWQKRKAWAMMHMGDVYKAQGNYSSANTYYRKAQRIFRNKKDQWGIDFLLIKIGFLLLDMGELQRSRDYIRKALKMATAIGAKYYEVMGLLCLGYISLITQNYAVATDCYERGKEMAEQLGEWALLLQLFILAANIYYYLKKYSKGLTTAHKAIKLAEQMHRKDLYVEVLLGKLKNGMKRGILSKIDSLQILDEAKKIAEEIRCPEILWKVYFEYGAFFQNDKQYHNALEYYQKCNYVFGDVISKIGNEKYKQSYIDRPDRFAVRTAVKEIGDILD